MISKARLKKLAKEHGTPLFVIDHDELRKNYRQFRKYLPRVQAYYAVKANPDPAIVRTLFKEGASFDVASMPEFKIVHENIKHLPAKKRQDWIWDKIIYANPTKPTETLEELDQYKPLVTFDNLEEIEKIKKHAPNAGLALRLKVPNTGAMVELSSKFGAPPGEAVDLILEADRQGLVVEGHQLPRRQPDDQLRELRPGAEPHRQHLQGSAGPRLHEDEPARHRRRLPRALRCDGAPVPRTREDHQHRDRPALPEEHPDPRRARAGSSSPPAGYAVSKIIGKAVRDGKPCYYINDGVYHTYSGVIFDHCKYPVKAFKKGPTQICSVFGPTCDALDVVSMAENLPDLERGDFVYSVNIGAYSHASATVLQRLPAGEGRARERERGDAAEAGALENRLRLRCRLASRTRSCARAGMAASSREPRATTRQHPGHEPEKRSRTTRARSFRRRSG